MFDPLDILNSLSTEELASTDTSFPNLAPDTKQFRVVEMKLEESKSGGKYILIQTKLESTDAISTAGEPIAPGYPVRHMINLSPSQKQIDKQGMETCVKNIKRDLAKFLEAVVGPDRTWDPSFELYADQTFFAKTRVSKERTDEATGTVYDPQTEFASFLPKTVDSDAAEVDTPY